MVNFGGERNPDFAESHGQLNTRYFDQSNNVSNNADFVTQVRLCFIIF